MALSKIKGFISNFTSSSSSSGGGGYNTSGVEQWRNLAKTALLLTSQYTESNLNALLTQMKHESGGNARAINLWDSNAKRGIPSKGLMQVILVTEVCIKDGQQEDTRVIRMAVCQ